MQGPVFTQTLPAIAAQVLHLEQIPFKDGTERVSSVNEVVSLETKKNSHYTGQTKRYGGTQSFAIFTQPAGNTRLFGTPMHERTYRSYDAKSVVGQLWYRSGETYGFETRSHVAERYSGDRADRLNTHDKFSNAAKYILQKRGIVRMTEVASWTGLGLRQFERSFLREVGSSPKLFARLTRFLCTLDYKISNPTRIWLDIAHKFGYHDQMHMIHEFEEFAGSSPRELLAQLRECALASTPRKEGMSKSQCAFASF